MGWPGAWSGPTTSAAGSQRVDHPRVPGGPPAHCPAVSTSGGRACGRMGPRCGDRVETQRRVALVELDDAAAWRAYRGFYRQGSKYLLSAGPTGAMLPPSNPAGEGTMAHPNEDLV